MEKLLRVAMFAFGFLITVVCVHALTLNKFARLQESALSSTAGSGKIPAVARDRDRHLECLARNIYYEAGNEPFEGKVAVAQVTINRSNNSRFPKDICQVVYQKNVIFSKVICQFSWYCEQAAIRRPLNKAAYNESMEVAKKVLLEDFRLGSIKTALFYHADYVNPGWGKKPITKIGQHIFYE
jgi:spore germination cell wall hydrolase CwlJ-like protein